MAEPQRQATAKDTTPDQTTTNETAEDSEILKTPPGPKDQWTTAQIQTRFGLTPNRYEAWKKRYIFPFVDEIRRSTDWLGNFNAATVFEHQMFQDFERKVFKECAFYRDAKISDSLRKRLLLVAVQRRLASLRSLLQRQRRKAVDQGRQTPSVSNGSQVGAQQSLPDTPSISNASHRADSSLRMFKEEIQDTISSFTDDEDVPASALHLRLSRLLGGLNPNLSYQVLFESLTNSVYTVPEDKIISMLSFDKLNTAARLYLGLDIREELLAIDHGTEKGKPQFMFVQDDASFRSTIQTWRHQHPRAMVVEVLVIDRPGFIPYRTKADLAKEEKEEESEAEEDEDAQQDAEDDAEDEEDVVDGNDEEMAG